MNIPVEFNLGGVYLPPLLVATVIGVVIAVATTFVMNHFRLSRYFAYLPLVFIALVVIFTVLAGTVLIPF